MTHPQFAPQLDAYLDGELAAVDARELEAHVAECPECRRFCDNRRALRAALKEQAPALTASETLRQRVRTQVRAAGTPRARLGMTTLWRPLAVAASLAVVALGSWQLAGLHSAGQALADEVFTSHIRSLIPGHLTDVPSSDQHTVKPWFNGKLDYSPPVYDFAGRGYPLIGGRLDYVGGRTVAALVYGRRQHMINVVLWPAARGEGATAGPASETRQGYHLLHWNTRDYTYWVASDLGWAELREFAGLLQQADVAAP